jgi:vacuolar protein sorting-associated protein 54
MHQDEIHTKLIAIMDDRLKSHAKTFDKVDWENMPQGKQVHSYAETIVSETSTLHNVLKRYLSPMVVEVIFFR